MTDCSNFFCAHILHSFRTHCYDGLHTQRESIKWCWELMADVIVNAAHPRTGVVYLNIFHVSNNYNGILKNFTQRSSRIAII